MNLTIEESNFLRFYFLNLKIASQAVKVYFDSVHPPAGLATELANSEAKLKGLRFITHLQLQILYPSNASNVTSDNFDTTLLICLLRNLPPRQSAPATGWDNLPHPGDTSIGADLARVKWYRNKLVHSNDGILSSTDVIQYWGDLEGAIGRLGGNNLLMESQSTKHIVLDKSLTDIITKIRINEHNIEEHREMLDNLQVAVDKQKTIKDQHEHRIQQLTDSLQKGVDEAQKHAAELSDHNESIDKYTEEIVECKKEIGKIYTTIKLIQDEVMDKQNQVDTLTCLLERLECKYNKKFKEIDGQLIKHDEQIATSAKDIEDLKKKQHNTGDIPGQSKQKRLEGDTKALIEEDLREDTFVTTKVVTDSLSLLKQDGVLLITGHAGTGKSRTGRHVLHMFCTGDTSFKCIKLNTLNELEDIVSREDNVAVLLDDIFGETNCIYNKEKDAPILDKVHAYVCKGNIKVIITIRDTVKRQCQEVFDSHRLFKFNFIDLSSDRYILRRGEKNTILTKYMKTVRQAVHDGKTGFVDCNGDTILKSDEVWDIIQCNPVKGFPLVVYEFIHNDKYFHLGSKFFDSPTEAILEDLRTLRRKGTIHSNDKAKFMLQYAVIVYTAINDNCIYPNDNSCVIEVPKIIDAIYGETIKLKKFHVVDAVMELKGSYLINIPNQRSYRLHHPTLHESVIISFALIDEENINKIIPLISWSFFLKMVKPESYKEKDGEVVLRIPTNSYKLLADRLAEFYMAEFTCLFLSNFSNTEIFQQDYSLLLPCLFEALEKEDTKDKHTENMIRYKEMYRFNSYFQHMKSKECFFAHLLDTLATSESHLDVYGFVLDTFNQIIKTSKDYYTICYMKFALISSLYAVCFTKDIRSVKATLSIVEENKIPVLLDQGVILTEIPNIITMSHVEDGSKTCVFLTLCIWNAYEVFNKPVLEFLLSKYNQTPFDINSFFKLMYRDKWIRRVICYKRIFRRTPSLSHIPLKWLIERFADQELTDVDYILEIAFKYQMFDTVEYLTSKYKSNGTVSCFVSFLRKNIDKVDWNLSKEPYIQELLNFLFTKINITSKELIPVVTLVLQKHHVPDYIFEAFLPVCLNNTTILTLASKNGQFYVVNQIMENSHFQIQLDIQSVIISACMKAVRKGTWHVHDHDHLRDIELEKLKIVKYIIGKFEFDRLDIKAACQQACDSRMFKIVEWFVQNIDMTMLDVYSIMDSTLKYSQPDILVCILEKIEIACLDKRKILKSVAKHYTGKCSTIILKIVSTIWNSTVKKEELKMQQIVDTAYEQKCFGLLKCIYNACNSNISIDGRTLLMLACGDDQTILNIDDAFPTFNPQFGSMVTWILEHFQIDPLDLKSGVFRLLSQTRFHRQHNAMCNLVVFILKKYLNSISTEDIELMMKTSLEHNYYDLVNWFLENKNYCSFDKQLILNKACVYAEIQTVKILREYFFALDMTQAMMYACNLECSFSDRYYGYNHFLKGFKDVQTWLSLLWNEIDHDSVDIGLLMSTVCKKKDVSNEVMTWVLLNLPQEQIPIKDVLMSCCQQRKINHVKYIFHTFQNEQLDINQAFFHACGKQTSMLLNREIVEHYDIMLVNYFFKKFHDKADSLSVVLNALLEKKKYAVIPYFLEEGFCENIKLRNLMKNACHRGHVKLVQWILENVAHEELDIVSAFNEAYGAIKHAKGNSFKKQCVMCLSLMWHYIQDEDRFEIATLLKVMTPDMSDSESDADSDSDAELYLFRDICLFKDSDDFLDILGTWLLYIRNINQSMICQSDSAM
ncbi:uncharacterized protein LOC127710637 isoform X1 [Mytilus californianus]|uniref:uncharacterized protein LOC127710637 isoform X1 n=1 Tax=Mytilus californianus TaxID=6549 RepID=UPI00224604BC|nr:uncharacterized protein LOC127710637 isoform X1 [Mytilus californianus]